MTTAVWDECVQWGETLTWTTPFTPKQQDQLQADIPQLVLSIRPKGSGSTWYAMAPGARAWRDCLAECGDDGQRYEVRFGIAPLGWIETIGEFDGW